MLIDLPIRHPPVLKDVGHLDKEKKREENRKNKISPNKVSPV